MIVEIAHFHIVPGREVAFEAAFVQARKVIARASGHLGHSLHRSHETPSQYALLVLWNTVEDHTEGFRGSELFVQWRALLNPFFAQPPSAGHFRPVATR
ncbi:MAG: antibiotic biosynthesis monooxygenase [Rudaea sp.]|uniref:antibiotic biosynthesis monooxygenase family protein n=1 Tax=Rudaea sp. TaxID=2136325 RepID=UPI0039E4957D